MTIEEAARELKSCIIDYGAAVSAQVNGPITTGNWIFIDSFGAKEIQTGTFKGYKVSWYEYPTMGDIETCKRSRERAGSEINV